MVLPVRLVTTLTTGAGSDGVSSFVKAVSAPFAFVPVTVIRYVVDGDGAVKVASGPAPSKMMPSPSIVQDQLLIAWSEDAVAEIVVPTKLLTTLTMGAGGVIVTGTSCSNTSVWPSAAVTVSSIGNNPELGKAKDAKAPVAGLAFDAPGANQANVAAPVELEASQNTTS